MYRRAACASRDSASPDPGHSARARLLARNFDGSKAVSAPREIQSSLTPTERVLRMAIFCDALGQCGRPAEQLVDGSVTQSLGPQPDECPDRPSSFALLS